MQLTSSRPIFLSEVFRFLTILPLVVLLWSCEGNESEPDVDRADSPTSAITNDPLLGEINRLSEEIMDNPDEPGNYINRSRAYAEMDKLQSAIADVKMAINLDSTVARWHYDHGNLQERLPFVKGALESYRTATRLDPNYRDAYLRRGILFFLIEDRENSFRNLNEALRIDPQLAEAYYYRGYNYRELDNVPKAMENFTRAAELRPEHQDTYLNLGLLAKEKGDAKARDYFNTAVRLDPSSIKARYSRGLFLQELDSHRAALEDFRYIAEADPAYARVQYSLGYSQYHLGDYPSARDAFQRAIQQASDSKEALYSLGLTQAQLKDTAAAADAFQKALEIDPQYTEAKDELQRLGIR